MKASAATSDMFDWNDEEIANIIWGGAGDSGDHIVPYPERGKEDGHKNLQSRDTSAIKPAENKSFGAKLDFHGIRPESSSTSSRNGRISASGMDSWPNISSSQVAKTDDASLDDEVFNDSALINKYLSKDIGPHDGNPEVYDLQGKELLDFVEYGWENIGSFDDLDRMFSDDEPMFTSVTLGNADKIWSSPKDTTNSPPKSFSITADSANMGSEILSKVSETAQVKSKYGEGGQSSGLSFEKMDDTASFTLQQKNEISDLVEGGGDESKSFAVEVNTQSTSSHMVDENILSVNEFADKVYGQKTPLKGQKSFKGKTKGKSLPSSQTSCSTRVNSVAQYKQDLLPSLLGRIPSSFNQLNQVDGPKSFNYHHISNSYMASPSFANYANPIEAIPQSSHFESGEFNCQTAFPGYEVASSDIDLTGKPLNSAGKSPLMTPQEKIEKLRRKRQMQAMLAIQKQLQQFGNQVSHDCVAQKSNLECPNQLTPGTNYDIDNLSAVPSVDVSCSNEQDESSTLSAAANGYSVEETVLHRLHKVVSKLDMSARISIRDSLFRLAKSAVQRQQTTDVSTNTITREQSQVVVKEENDATKREVKVNDVETDTNPTDRAVAHLLFHRPMENSIKHPQTPESSLSAKLNLDRLSQGGVNLQMVESRKSSKTELAFPSQGSGSPCPQQMDCMDTSENAPDCSNLGVVATEVGASG